MMQTSREQSPLQILDFFCDRAQYRPGESIGLVLEVDNRDKAGVRGCCRLTLIHLDQTVQELVLDEELAPGVQRITLSLEPRSEPLAGFGVELTIEVDDRRHAVASTAFDVAADRSARIRYGFLSNFTTEELGKTEDVELLAKLHINHVQFYDWMYRHDTLVPPSRHFADPMGKRGDLEVIKEKIAACKSQGIRSIAYGAVYAATKEFFELHPDWALYHSDGTPYCFIERFYIMNISRHSLWSNHITEQFRQVIGQLGFDGIHMDTYGFPKRALAFSRGDGEEPVPAAGAWASDDRRKLPVVELREELPALIEQTRETVGGEATLIFNNVDAWPMETTAAAPQDGVYIEVWSPHTRYRHLVELIASARRLGGGKPVILAAYLLPFKGADSEQALIEAEHSALLATAVITSAGGSHLLLGEEAGLLTEAYYVDHATLRPAFLEKMRRYYDFLVRYSELFFDSALVDVTTSHLGVEFPDYSVDGVPVSATGEAGRVWVTVHESAERRVISLVNLIGLEDDRWNTGHAPAPPQSGLRVSARVLEGVGSIYTASPDSDSLRAHRLPYSRHAGFEEATAARPETADGEVYSVTLPVLRTWAVIVVELGA